MSQRAGVEVGRGESTDVRGWPKISKEQDADKESYQFLMNRVQRGKDISKERELQLQEVFKKSFFSPLSLRKGKHSLLYRMILQKPR